MNSIKQYIQTTLKGMGLYHRLRASHIYDLYWMMADSSVIDEKRRECEFYRNLLVGFRPGDLIFDIGANHGTKTNVFLTLGARVVAMEPDQLNQKILREMFLRYRLTPKPVVIVGKAVSDTAGVETMWIDQPGSAKNTLSQKWVHALREDEERFGERLDFAQRKQIETTTLENQFATHGVPYFVKIDVEGYEVSVIRGMRQPVPFLSFEVNLPEFRQEGLLCVSLLHALAPDGKFNYTVECGRGLELDAWLPANEFAQRLERCAERSIEVTWKTSAVTQRP